MNSGIISGKEKLFGIMHQKTVFAYGDHLLNKAYKPMVIKEFTSRLCIKSYDPSDYPYCLTVYSDPQLTRFFDHGRPRTQAEIKAYIEERGSYFFDQGIPFGLFSVFLKEDASFIGQVDIVPTGNPGEVEIGWIFCKEFQNFGYCSESVKEFLIPFVKNLSRNKVEVYGKVIDRIVATAHPENLASQRIMQKAGLSFFKRGLRYGGNPRNWYQLNLGKQNEQ